MKKSHNKSARNASLPPKSAKAFVEATSVVDDPPRPPPPLRLIDKAEVLRRVAVTYPTVWRWMNEGVFPHSRNIGGKSAWLEHEVEAWIAARPGNKFGKDYQLSPDHPHFRLKVET